MMTLLYNIILFVIIILSFIFWYNYLKLAHTITEHLDDKCSDAMCIKKKFLLSLRSGFGTGIKKMKAITPAASPSGNLGRLAGNILGDITTSVVAVLQAGKAIVSTGAMSADLGSAFIQSVR